MGTDNKDKEHKDGIAMAIVKDTKDQSYWTYRLSTEQTITGDSIGELPINKDSQFATTSAFPDQFFYTVDSKVYLFNVASLETYELYDAGSPITKCNSASRKITNLPKNGIICNAVWHLL